ncbi:MAG: GTP pyrophosphokinase [Firmicutes bacterium]|nr:GTP pyrophosphokinase [Bacillota bacterium]
MIYTDLTKEAMKICFAAHKEQLDKSGMPYVFHPFHLAEQMPDEYTTAAALLHDTVEDAGITLEYLTERGMPDCVTDAVRLLTHDDSVPYLDYVRKIKCNDIAKTVKRADLIHNSDLTRLDNVGEEDLRRAEKYRKAIEILNE